MLTPWTTRRRGTNLHVVGRYQYAPHLNRAVVSYLGRHANTATGGWTHDVSLPSAREATGRVDVEKEDP